MEMSKENIQQIFNNADKDGNGTLSKEEISAVLNQMGEHLSQNQLNKLIKAMDVDGDGKITFNEFYQWFIAKQSGLQNLIFFKQNALKKLTKAGQITQQVGANVHGAFSTHQLALKVGEPAIKSLVGLKLLTGPEGKNQGEDVKNGLNMDDKPCIILKIKCFNADAARQQFEEVFETVKVMIQEMIPEGEKYVQDLKISFAVPTPDYCVIGFQLANQMIDEMMSEVLESLNINQFVDDQQTTKATFQLGVGITPNCWVENHSIGFTELLGKNGFKFTGELKINQGIIDKVRELYYHKIESLIEKQVNYKLKKLKNLLLLFLLQNSRVSMNFDYLEGLGDPSFDYFMDYVKEERLGGSTVKEMAQEIPIVSSVVECFEQYCQPEGSIHICTNLATLSLNIQTQGIHNFFKAIYE